MPAERTATNTGRSAAALAALNIAHWNNSALFKGLREIAIHYNGAEFCLRTTAADKLILTK